MANYRLLINATVLVPNRFIPESARWLLGRGKIEETKQLFRKVAATNKRTVPESLEEVLTFTVNWNITYTKYSYGEKAYLTKYLKCNEYLYSVMQSNSSDKTSDLTI